MEEEGASSSEACEDNNDGDKRHLDQAFVKLEEELVALIQVIIYEI
jgi:hypothetical protein